MRERFLTIKQPWASLAAYGLKPVENRTKPIPSTIATPARVWVHAGARYDHKGFDRALELFLAEWNRGRGPWSPLVFVLGASSDPDVAAGAGFPRGALLGPMTLTGCHPWGDCLAGTAPQGAAGCSRWAEDDRYHIALADPRPLPDPIPMRGAQGWPYLPDDIRAEALEQLEAAAQGARRRQEGDGRGGVPADAAHLRAGAGRPPRAGRLPRRGPRGSADGPARRAGRRPAAVAGGHAGRGGAEGAADRGRDGGACLGRPGGARQAVGRGAHGRGPVMGTVHNSRIPRHKGLSQGSGLARTGPPKPQSRKRRAQQKVRRGLAGRWEGEACWLAVPGVCTGRAEAWHELVGSGVGGSRVDARNTAASCWACNSHLETMPDRYELGLKVRSWEAVPGDGGLVPARLSPYSLAARQERDGSEAA